MRDVAFAQLPGDVADVGGDPQRDVVVLRRQTTERRDEALVPELGVDGRDRAFHVEPDARRSPIGLNKFGYNVVTALLTVTATVPVRPTEMLSVVAPHVRRNPMKPSKSRPKPALSLPLPHMS